MKSNTRFIKSAIETSKSADVVMPWTRGKRRVEFISSRTAPTNLQRVSTA